MQSHNDHNQIDETQIRNNRNEIDKHLLICFQSFDVDPVRWCQLSLCCPQADDSTYVLSPDSVDALTPKKYASMAARLPYG